MKTEAEAAREKAKTDKVDLLRLGDLAAAAAPIGFLFGRIANFINGELWGRVTDGPFGHDLLQRTADAAERRLVPRRHSIRAIRANSTKQRWKALRCLRSSTSPTLRFDTLRRPGMNTGIFLVAYGLFRALLETVREPDAHMPEALRGFITMGMLLSIPMMLGGAWLIHRALKQPKLAAA